MLLDIITIQFLRTVKTLYFSYYISVYLLKEHKSEGILQSGVCCVIVYSFVFLSVNEGMLLVVLDSE